MNEARALLQLKAWGLQKELSRRSGIINSTISYIFSGIRRATIPQAEKLEAEFIRLGIPLDRWDLMYGVRVSKEHPESLTEYWERRDKNMKGGKGDDGDRKKGENLKKILQDIIVMAERIRADDEDVRYRALDGIDRIKRMAKEALQENTKGE